MFCQDMFFVNGTFKLRFMKFLVNPWNHRADISAEAYLKPSKKGKKNVTELFHPNKL
jgi:hypothetical protein